MKKKNMDALIIGAALFSMFFGAGNLIFPPQLGLAAGNGWIISTVGFFITAIGLPVLSIIASIKAGGGINRLGNRVSPLFSKLLGITVVIAIGPLLAIPRTAATAFEMAIEPNSPGVSPLLFSIIYFGIVLAFVIKPNNVIDRIGKVLTPVLLALLGVIIIKGIVDPIGHTIAGQVANPFSDGFTTGYQTMDALTAMLFGGIITTSLIQSGYMDDDTQLKMTIKAGLIAGVGLTIVYGGLGYLGATAGSLYPQDITKVDLIMNIANDILRTFGEMGLGVVVSLACLTTAVGITTTVGQYFSEITKGKLKYQWVVIATCFFSILMSLIGVESIISFADPILIFIYPIVIVMILLTIISGDIPNKNVYRSAVSVTVIISTLELMNMFGILPGISQVVNYLPFASWELGWIIPAIIGAGVGLLVTNKSKHKTKIN